MCVWYCLSGYFIDWGSKLSRQFQNLCGIRQCLAGRRAIFARISVTAEYQAPKASLLVLKYISPLDRYGGLPSSTADGVKFPSLLVFLSLLVSYLPLASGPGASTRICIHRLYGSYLWCDLFCFVWKLAPCESNIAVRPTSFAILVRADRPMHFDPSLKKEGTDPPALALGIRNSCLVIQL